MSRLLKAVFSARTLAYGAGSAALVSAGGYYYLNSGPAYPSSTLETRRPPPPWTPPSRNEMLARLKDGEEYDLLIVGGGATGAGVAVDAATRGLKVALVERNDFASGTSSKSTKLVHGGVRYLQKAVFELDYDQYKLVKEALHERRIFLHTAPYLSSMLPIMLPVYKYWQVPYYFAGCKMYDVLAGKENMETSYLMSKGKALETFPMLKSDGLVGAVVYYDGQHNDSRMNMALIMTAVKHGATVANYVEVTDLHKSADGKLTGASVKETLNGETWNIKAKGVINATGPFSDTLLTLDNPEHKPIVQPSSGIHITLPNYYSPRKMGLLDPATSDGRVIFFLPWQGNTIAGTTDTPSKVTTDPVAPEDEIRWVLEEVRHYLSPDIKVRRGDVLSAWSGLRPLVRNPAASNTEGLVRNHMIYTSPSGLLTIAGGKWTTYREMAQQTVDEAVKVFGLGERVNKLNGANGGCVTENIRLVGSDGWSRNMFIGLVQRFGIATDVAKHLSESYGDRAWTICELAEKSGETWPVHGKRLNVSYPYIEAEVRYAVRDEYAQTAIDVIARRTRLSFLNAGAALQALPRVVEVMGEEYGWSRLEKHRQMEEAIKFLGSMGLQVSLPSDTVSRWWRTGAALLGLGESATLSLIARDRVYTRSQFDLGEVTALRAAFQKAVVAVPQPGPEPEVDITQVRDLVNKVGFGYSGISDEEFKYVLVEAGFEGGPAARKDGKAGGRKTRLGWDEFIELCGSLKEVSGLGQLELQQKEREKQDRKIIPVEKSGGGV